MGMMQTGHKVRDAQGDRRSAGDALWLAGEDIQRTWPAYPGSAAYMGFLGVFFGLPGAPEVGTYGFEFIMFAVGLLLATPFFAREYMSWSTDPIAERLAWLRALPIGVPTIVWSRAIAILASLPLNVIAFFTPVWFGGGWGMRFGEFLWFCTAIIGVSLVGAGATLALEMSVGIRRWIITNVVVMVVLFAAMIIAGVLIDFRFFEQLVRAVEWNGPLVALSCLVAGGAMLLWCVRLAEDGLRRRELAS